MQHYTISGEIKTGTKKLYFSDCPAIVVGENRITTIQIALTDDFQEQTFAAFLLLKEYGGTAVISSQLTYDEENNTVIYQVLNSAFTVSGAISLVLLIEKDLGGDKKEVFRSEINTQLYVKASLIDAIPAPEEMPTLLSEITTAIDYANTTTNQIIEDRDSGVFNGKDGKDGEKGEKGDPSSLDKLGINATVINLSDRDVSTFGTQDAPILISEESTITFVGYTPIPGYKKSFELCIKRTADVAVIWAQITEPNWAYREIPLLPVGKAQEIKVTTVDGVNYYGTGGDVF